MDLLGLTSSELQRWGSRDILGGPELPGIEARALGAAFSCIEELAEATVPFLGLPPTEPVAGGPYLRLHQPGSHCVPCPGESLRPCPN